MASYVLAFFLDLYWVAISAKALERTLDGFSFQPLGPEPDLPGPPRLRQYS